MPFPLDTEDKKKPGVEITRAVVRRWWIWVFAALLAGLLGYTGSIFSEKRAAGQGPPSVPAAPVVVAAATLGDISVYVAGLGTVTALYTATILPQVTGQILQVPFKEGDFVKKGALLVQIDPRPYEATLLQAQGQLERDKALLANAKIDLKRYETLAAQDSIALQQRDTQIYLVQQYEGAIKLDEGLVQSAKINLGYTRITSPFNGRIGLRLVDPGNVVYTPDTNGIAVITQEQPITVIFPIPEDNMQAVMKKLKAGERLKVEAFDRAQRTKLATGYLLTADNQIDTTTGTVRLKAQFSNQDSALFPNQFVNARLLMETLRGVTVVPTAAIQRSPKGTYVFLVKEDKTATVRWVRTGPAEGENLSIEEGLSPGDTVVVEGTERLKEGSRVEVQTQGSDSSGKGK
ncbi:MAG: MdtA/MuxA family multidrug efflux RND transporter periplasmic adaptor subunit [Syntrophobacteraceae bacterium]|jgi:multidrug efflux system membrane fusion protein